MILVYIISFLIILVIYFLPLILAYRRKEPSLKGVMIYSFACFGVGLVNAVFFVILYPVPILALVLAMVSLVLWVVALVKVSRSY
jgi:hypothetical protein